MALSTKVEYRLPLELDPSLERLPLEELVRLGQRKLFESQVLQRALARRSTPAAGGKLVCIWNVKLPRLPGLPFLTPMAAIG